MARIRYVKKAQQRYRTVPVLDSEGKQKVTAVTRRSGDAKVTKTGREVTRRVTVADKNQPLPPYTCGHCHEPIEVGTPYKHVSIGGVHSGRRTLRRHAACPTWKPSELTTSKMASVYAAQEAWGEFLESNPESEEDVRQALDEMAESVREVAEEYRESADNIRDGFGHDTYQSEELDEKADTLEQWAQEIESVDVPECPEEEVDCDDCQGTGETDCDECGGVGSNEADEECDVCDGSGTVECEECSGTGQVENEESFDSWRDQVAEISEPDDCPL